MLAIAAMLPQHWEAVKNIYEEGIATGHATFQQSAPGWDEWDRNHIKTCRLLAIENDTLLGWAALSSVSSRPVYAGVAEVSIYIAAIARGKGVGSRLLNELILASEQHGFWTLQSGIFPENTASISLHQKNGFRIIGYREKIGKMKDQWRDNIYFERRSTVTGIA